MDIVFSQDPQDFVRRDWSALVTADPAGTVFHTPAFLKLYWEEFADLPDHLLLAFAEEDGDQVGAVAFERFDGTLRFLGGTEVTDYMGPVGLPEARPTVAKELFAALARTDDWVEADLRGLPEDRPWLGLLVEAAAAQGFSTEVFDDQNGVAPFLPLPGSYPEYLERLPAKLRHEIKRKARRLEAEVGPWHICLATPETLEPFLDRFVELHRTSEGTRDVNTEIRVALSDGCSARGPGGHTTDVGAGLVQAGQGECADDGRPGHHLARRDTRARRGAVPRDGGRRAGLRDPGGELPQQRADRRASPNGSRR